MNKRLLKWILAVVTLLLLIVGAWLAYCYLGEYISSRQAVVDYVKTFGSLAPIVSIGLIIVEILIAPLPGGWVPLATGFLFGPWLGSLYSWSANVLGSLLLMFLMRKLGRPLANYFFKKQTLDFYDKFIHDKQNIVWIFYIIPFLPMDTTSALLGLSKTPLKKFFPIILIGLIPHIVLLNILGYWFSDLNIENIVSVVSFISVVVLLGIVVWAIRLYLKKRQK